MKILLAAVFASSTIFAADPIAHSFLGCGKGNKAILIAEDGTVEWKLELPASDGTVLSDGRILLALYACKGFPNGGAVIVDRESKDILWQYVAQGKEVSTAVMLENGNVLVAEPRAVEIDPEGEVVTTTPLACQKDKVHMQTRMLRVLPNGNYLAPHLFDFAVMEYVPGTGEVVATLATDERGREHKDWPFSAIRKEDGNTLISYTNGNRVIELNPEGEIVWQVTNEDLEQPVLSDACGLQLLPSGNIVVTNYRAKGEAPRLVEITREKEVVWSYVGQPAGFHNFQILTTNGEAVDSAGMR